MEKELKDMRDSFERDLNELKKKACAWVVTLFNKHISDYVDKLSELESKQREIEKKSQAMKLNRDANRQLGLLDSDIIKLNVGGQTFTTNRATLTQVEGSKLKNLFSGNQGNIREVDGHLVLDRDP